MGILPSILGYQAVKIDEDQVIATDGHGVRYDSHDRYDVSVDRLFYGAH